MAAITESRREYPLAALLKLPGIPRSTYYYHSRKANEVDKYAKERAEIIAIYQENQGRYGYRRIGIELRNRGFCLNHSFSIDFCTPFVGFLVQLFGVTSFNLPLTRAAGLAGVFSFCEVIIQTLQFRHFADGIRCKEIE